MSERDARRALSDATAAAAEIDARSEFPTFGARPVEDRPVYGSPGFYDSLAPADLNDEPVVDPLWVKAVELASHVWSGQPRIGQLEQLRELAVGILGVLKAGPDGDL